MSPTEDLSFDSTLHVIPGLQLDGSGFDSGDAPFNLDGPRCLSIGVGWAIKAGQKFSGNFGASLEIEAQSIGKNSFDGLGHVSDLTLGFAAQQALQPSGQWRMMARG